MFASASSVAALTTEAAPKVTAAMSLAVTVTACSANASELAMLSSTSTLVSTETAPVASSLPLMAISAWLVVWIAALVTSSDDASVFAIVSVALDVALSAIVLAVIVSPASSVIAAASTGEVRLCPPVRSETACVSAVVTEAETPAASETSPANSIDDPAPSILNAVPAAIVAKSSAPTFSVSPAPSFSSNGLPAVGAAVASNDEPLIPETSSRPPLCVTSSCKLEVAERSRLVGSPILVDCTLR